jgi:ABC-type lipoprotein release transport system permease subunit
MTLLRLVLRTVAHHARDHLLVLLGIAVAAMVITGSLVIGDSVRGSLHATALARIGQVDVAVVGNGRFLKDSLASTVAGRLGAGATVAPVLDLRGLASNGEHRANAIAVCGVDARFWRLAPTPAGIVLAENEVALNAALAHRLQAKVGDSVLLRVEKPGFLPRDAPLSSTADTTVAMRVRVGAVLDEASFGRFSLAAAQVPTPTAFIALASLQQRTGMAAIANLLLVGGAEAVAVDAAVTAAWTPEDALVEVRRLGERTEVRAERIFLDDPLSAALAALPGSAGVMTYFVNELRLGGRATPYSLVASADWERLPQGGAPIPADLGDDGIAINQWLADDLEAAVGDRLTVTYFVIGPAGGLREDSATLTVRAVVPLQGNAADRELMPRFPGIADEEDCKDWHPGVPIDLGRIRPVDEDYWKHHRGTPKAFLSLAAGQRLFANRFGSLTAVRLPQPIDAVVVHLRTALKPADLGLMAVPLRAQALEASAKAMDFSGLFIGLGLFLVVAALTLAGMLVALGLERRRAEIGLLLAVGFTPRRVARLLWWECVVVACLGSLLGTVFGVLYALAVLTALAGGWSAAVGSTPVGLHLQWPTLAIGVVASALVATVVLRWRLRRLHREAPPVLLAGRAGGLAATVAERPLVRLSAVLGVLGTIVLLLCTALYPAGSGQRAGVFFAAGAMLLATGICVAMSIFDLWFARGLGRLSFATLALTNAARGRGRSVAVIVMLSAACFLVLAVGANRRDPLADAQTRSAGTGGYALAMDSAVPLAEDLGSAADRERLGLEHLDGVAFTAIRVGHGDDASCLNLNRSATPRIHGVDPAAFAGRFTFAAPVDGGWNLLDRRSDEVVPAIGDVNTTMWSLGMAVGDRLTYHDERGRPFTIELVGTVAHSLLQGGLFISERDFIARFPSRGGHGLWLVDVPAERREVVAKELERGLADYGVVVQPAVERLAAYLAVERTYLDIFLTLGGLALLIGSVGVGVVVARNVADRRGELAAAHAIGFSRGLLLRLLLTEHALLLLAGLLLGAVSGAVAIWPALRAPGTPVPWGDLGVALAVILASGLLVILVATRRALAGTTIDALRKE